MSSRKWREELEKLGPDAPLAKAGARLLAAYIDWAEKQSAALAPGESRAALLRIWSPLCRARCSSPTPCGRTRFSRSNFVEVEPWLDEGVTRENNRGANHDRRKGHEPERLDRRVHHEHGETCAAGGDRHPGDRASEARRVWDTDEGVLSVGVTGSDFSLPYVRGGMVSASLLAKGPTVVTFYRGGWCPFCDLQLRAYQSVLPEIRRLGAELVAISRRPPTTGWPMSGKRSSTSPSSPTPTTPLHASTASSSSSAKRFRRCKRDSATPSPSSTAMFRGSYRCRGRLRRRKGRRARRPCRSRLHEAA